MFHVRCDMWHKTHDMQLMTCDRWGEVNLLSNFSSLVLTVFECSRDCSTNTLSINSFGTSVTHPLWNYFQNTFTPKPEKRRSENLKEGSPPPNCNAWHVTCHQTWKNCVNCMNFNKSEFARKQCKMNLTTSMSKTRLPHIYRGKKYVISLICSSFESRNRNLPNLKPKVILPRSAKLQHNLLSW